MIIAGYNLNDLSPHNIAIDHENKSNFKLIIIITHLVNVKADPRLQFFIFENFQKLLFWKRNLFYGKI
jgi:hypothetical protein